MTNTRTYIRSFQKLLFENYISIVVQKVFSLNSRIYKTDSLKNNIKNEDSLEICSLDFLKEKKVKINFIE